MEKGGWSYQRKGSIDPTDSQDHFSSPTFLENGRQPEKHCKKPNQPDVSNLVFLPRLIPRFPHLPPVPFVLTTFSTTCSSLNTGTFFYLPRSLYLPCITPFIILSGVGTQLSLCAKPPRFHCRISCFSFYRFLPFPTQHPMLWLSFSLSFFKLWISWGRRCVLSIFVSPVSNIMPDRCLIYVYQNRVKNRK